MTTSLELKNKLKFLPSFMGVHPCDQLPDVTALPTSLIMNTQPHNQNGEHWVAIHINKEGSGIYFDSYGLEPLKNEFRDFLEKYTNRWKHNNIMLQGLNSITCGEYCVLFILCRSLNYSLSDMIGLFSKNKTTNDEILRKIYKNL